ncbi:hypothetical protein [Histidinibacterium lentulum]|uniref:Uncharacterized protein n=1 Tax=Histidinibacterium lentulum TaxID=2480588 RepID=A0A3N2R8W3_9RHOB|nr:hypothetical protein [Histidinibacterium lentulum]ROU03904.1 hypothetical protein EAT49_00385 [Histidinibacterium lentulum]
MTRFFALGSALCVCLLGTAAAAQSFDQEPFAISLGVTFSAPMDHGMAMTSDYDDPLGGLGPLLGGVDTLSATVATGGMTAVSNATAAVIDGETASSSNGGASSNPFAPLSSEVSIGGNGFTSSVGNGTYGYN